MNKFKSNDRVLEYFVFSGIQVINNKDHMALSQS